MRYLRIIEDNILNKKQALQIAELKEINLELVNMINKADFHNKNRLPVILAMKERIKNV